eukprot:Tbor_TRINITY_DN2840_c0_g1::TRINITY_DN2840_c0_g1_i1::g.23254::m.23254
MTSFQTDISTLHKYIAAGDEKYMTDFLNLNSSNSRRLIDSVNSDTGYTALFFVCVERFDVSILNALLKFRPTVDIKGADNETALYIACHNRLGDHVKALLAAGADKNSKNGVNGEVPLHPASCFGFVNIVDTLFKSGADLNARNKKGETPLFLASKAGLIDMVFFLLAMDASKNIVDRDGKSPLYIASENSHKYVVALLKAEKSSLRETKSRIDSDIKNEPEKMASLEEIADKLRKRKIEEEKDLLNPKKKVSEIEKKIDELEMTCSQVRPPPVVQKIRTHDPFTGKSLGPCRSLEEVGYTLPPPIPPGIELKPVVYPPRGGTSMVVGTGTNEEIKQPPQIFRGDIEEDGPTVMVGHPVSVGEVKSDQN